MEYLCKKHLKEVAQIEATAHAEEDSDFGIKITKSYAWTEQDFIDKFREPNVVGKILKTKFGIAGFVIYKLEGDTLTIIDLAVHPFKLRVGHGTRIVTELMEKSKR